MQYKLIRSDRKTVTRMIKRQEAVGLQLQRQDLERTASFFAGALQGQLIRWVKKGLYPSPVAYRESVARVLQLMGPELSAPPQ